RHTRCSRDGSDVCSSDLWPPLCFSNNRSCMSTQKQLSGPLKKAAMGVAILVILLIWQSAAWTLPDFLMPNVPSVIARLWEDIQSGDFRAALSGSLTRLGFGYGFALLFGVGFGLVGALLFFFREVLKNAIIILQSIPS